jgi:formylglycine-generating enzyme required for sulfatase activity/serine/threonine protein kinase
METTPISTQALPAGTRIEEFLIELVLGSGGFGITYLARDTALGRQVVIKENLPVQFCFRDTHSLTVAPRHTHGEDPENFRWSLENFSKEAAMLASLDHPGIVRVLRSFQAFGTAYFVMPFVEGVALDELAKSRQEKAFTEDELRGLLERVLDALIHLHDRGIYHRDIKPGNILITNEGIPVLIDFGSARQRLSERSMTVVESAGYTPFEQLQSRGNVGPWSDLYALGGTIEKSITGETPPKAMDRMRRDPRIPLAQRPDLAARYSALLLASIDQALSVEEAERWQNAAEWLAALRGVAATAAPPPPVSARTEMPERPPVIPIIPGSKASRLPWAIAGCAILVLGAWVTISSSKNPGEHPVTVVDDTPVQRERDKAEAATAQAKAAEQRAAQLEQEKQALIAQAKAKEEAAKMKEEAAVKAAEQQREAELAKAKEESAKVIKATKDQPFVNSLGMKFVPLKITGVPSAGQQVLFSIWETRVQDYRKYAAAKSDVNGEWKSPGFKQREDHPVVKVSWEDAVAFCAWLTEKDRSEGKILATAKYRLPTDHEWSCAVGIGDREDAAATLESKNDKLGDVYPWSRQWPPPAQAGNYDPGLRVDSYEYTSPVGSFAAKGNGIHDLGGNVREWCEDLYSSSQTDRVLRGGSWFDDILVVMRSAYRSDDDPRSRFNINGFRVVLVGGGGSLDSAAGQSEQGKDAATAQAKEEEQRAAELTKAKSTNEEASKIIKAGEERDFEIAPNVKIKMCWIPPGEFMMGSPAGESGRQDDETQHRVKITQGFWLAKTEVTQAQWRAVMGSNPSRFKGEDLPVESVSWNDIAGPGGFIEKANQSGGDGGRFSLPTEAQWEYACRAGTTGAYAGEMDQMAWYDKNSGEKTHPVGLKKPNAWGLHDMHGNVWEWCSDWYGAYPDGAVTDPRGTVSGSARVGRGGSWGNIADYCRVAYRGNNYPAGNDGGVGFRPARSSVP